MCQQQPGDACQEGPTFCSFLLLLLHLGDVTSCLLLSQLREKGLEERRGSHYSRNFPEQSPTTSLFPLSASSFSPQNRCLFHHQLLYSSFYLNLFSISPSLSPLPQASFLAAPLHPLFLPPALHSPVRASFTFPPPRLSYSVIRQLFFPGSVLFRAD